MKRLVSVLLAAALLLASLAACAETAEDTGIFQDVMTNADELAKAVREAYADAQPHEDLETIRREMEVVSMETAQVPFYTLTSQEKTEMEVTFFNENRAVAYLEVDALFDTLHTLAAASDPGYELRGEYGDGFYLAVRENGEFALVDFENGIVAFSDYDMFGRSSSAVSGGDILAVYPWQTDEDGEVLTGEDGQPLVNLFSRLDSARNFTRYGYSMAAQLAECNIPIYWNDGKGYLPVTTFSDLFLPAVFAALVYNGEAMFLTRITGFDDTVTDGEGKTLRDILFDVSAERSRELAEYTYWEMVMMLEGNYGLREEHLIGDSFDAYLEAIGLKERLMDTDGSVFTDALAELLYGYFGDLHSAMVQRSPFAGETYHFDYATHPNLSSSIGATLSTGERYAAARSVSACVDESGALIPYQEVGNTAYITFDSFDMDLGRDYYDPEVRQAIPGMIAADNIALIHYANERINREDSPIENVVIDLSHNSGGMADAAIFVISWALGTCRFSTVNPKSEAQYTVGYQADVNLDGRITAADALDLSRFKVYCLISEFSFSCGNLVPAAFKESGLVTLLGRKSGGGACVVQPAVAADGTVYQYSSRYRLSTVKNGSYYSIDQGVEPDFVISDPAHFYDRAWLTGYICQLP